MPSPTHVGPLRTIAGEGGVAAPFYVITFDKNGVCTSPLTQRHLLDEAVPDATDVFLFSHGWNNDWAAATNRYDDMVEHFARLRAKHWQPPDRDYRPVLVGVFWPSTTLVAPSEQAPDIAAGGVPDTGQVLDEMETIAGSLDPGQAARFYELVQHDTLDEAQARELAQLLSPHLAADHDELDDGSEPPSADDLLSVWRQQTASPDGAARGAEGGFIDDEPVEPSDAQTAGIFDRFDPRGILRSVTVLLMKDRAGRVGARGVRSLLHEVLERSTDARVHLVGHSYGGKVVLSALAHGSAPSRPVESVLLLQPATSALCFAVDADGKGRPGGYRPALERSMQPIMTTYSRKDVALTKLFHLAARRRSDLGEAVIAGAPPSRYAALGGFGPIGATDDVTEVAAVVAPNPYDVETPGKRIIAVRAHDVITGHGDVTNDATAWALLCQVSKARGG